jgi:general secretion pathway protein K
VASASRPSEPARAHRRRGFALVATVWISAVLALACLELLAASRRGSTTAWRLQEQARAVAAAEAGIAIGAQALLGSAAPPERIERGFEGSDLRITIEAESDRIDLNTAPRARLRALLARVAANEGEADRLLAAIEDWRDADDARRDGGAELDDYLRAGAAVLPRDADFESVAELVDVAGFDAERVAALAPSLTVYGSLRPRQERGSRIGQAYRITAEALRDGARARRVAILRPTGNASRPLLRHAAETGFVEPER